MPNEPRDNAPDPLTPDTDVLSAPTSQLDLVEAGKPARKRSRSAPMPPQVRLGELREGGLAPAIMAIVERGVRRRPAAAARLTVEVEFSFEEPYPPVRVAFGERLVLVEDGPAKVPDLRIKGTLPDLISMMVAPLLGGLPNPISSRGRAALGMVALRRVRVEGRLGLMRRVLGVIRI